jgi:hypothetical protein
MADKFNRNFDLDELINSLPSGLDRALLRTLSFHVGREQAISRAKLIEELAKVGFDYRKEDRPMRACINVLRKAGHPICSTGGRDSGYWLAANWDELNEYLDREVRSRLSDLREQEQALAKAARQLWGEPNPQMSLFG